VKVTDVPCVEKTLDLILSSMPAPLPLTFQRQSWISYSSRWEGVAAVDTCMARGGRRPSLLAVFETRSSQGAASLYVRGGPR
jgi:hypothetical protein